MKATERVSKLSEGDSNLSRHRQRWHCRHVDAETQGWLERELTPPLTIHDSELDRAISILETAFEGL